MEKTVDILGEMEAQKMGMTYNEYRAWLRRGAWLGGDRQTGKRERMAKLVSELKAKAAHA
jgi:hypothetical protein